MPNSGRRGFVDPRRGDEGEFADELRQSLRKANRLRHLYDIFRGETKEPATYYENGGSAFDDPHKWASYLAASYPDQSAEFMNRADVEFTHHNLKQNSVIDFLAEEGISRRVSEELVGSWTERLLLTYHALYDSETGDTPGYDLLLAKARLFKSQSKLTYEYDELDLDGLEGRVTSFVRSHNKGDSRPLSIDCHDVGEEEYVLDFYQESARIAQPVFDIRRDGEEGNPLEPNIEYDSTYAVKTLSANIAHDGDTYEVTYSKALNNWNGLLERFSGDVLGWKDPFDDGRRKRTDTVEDVLESALDALDDEEATDDDVIDAVDKRVEEVSDRAMETDATEEVDESIDELEDIYESIELVGISVQGVEEALTDSFQVRSTATLRDWTDRNVSNSDSLKRVVEDADPASIGLVFRAHLRGADDPPEEFILQDGIWKSRAGGLSDAAKNRLKLLFRSHDE
ncbi:hypothetical protein [Salinarchaeum laminariae]|uniref:hypothetical protein n=1 Tax=Salinarchaeum laminariae TaxID=869888 RepID=UPI0020BF071E|nr:hypothetical protein [Salinarchaeum laminariae]